MRKPYPKPSVLGQLVKGALAGYGKHLELEERKLAREERKKLFALRERELESSIESAKQLAKYRAGLLDISRIQADLAKRRMEFEQADVEKQREFQEKLVRLQGEISKGNTEAALKQEYELRKDLAEFQDPYRLAMGKLALDRAKEEIETMRAQRKEIAPRIARTEAETEEIKARTLFTKKQIEIADIRMELEKRSQELAEGRFTWDKTSFYLDLLARFAESEFDANTRIGIAEMNNAARWASEKADLDPLTKLMMNTNAYWLKEAMTSGDPNTVKTANYMQQVMENLLRQEGYEVTFPKMEFKRLLPSLDVFKPKLRDMPLPEITLPERGPVEPPEYKRQRSITETEAYKAISKILGVEESKQKKKSLDDITKELESIGVKSPILDTQWKEIIKVYPHLTDDDRKKIDEKLPKR